MKGMPTTPSDTWFQNFDLPSRLFGTGRTDYELYEEDDQFVLSVELPGFEKEEIDLAWDDGQLNVAARHEDESVGERRTYHRRFRFPKTVVEEDISAEYTNGVLKVYLPIENTVTRGKTIEIEG